MHTMSRRGVLLGSGAAALSLYNVRSAAWAASGSETDADTEAEIEASVAEEIDLIHVGDRDRYSLLRSEAPINPDRLMAVIAQGTNYPAPPLDDALTRTLSQAKYWQVPPASRVSPRWSAPKAQLDYHHFYGTTAPLDFTLSDGVLTLLAERNAFTFSDASKLRLIGLRGCALKDGAVQSDWSTSHDLVLAEPDHIHPRCLVGLWRPVDKMIRLYLASTVPQVGNMFASLKTKGWGTSMLPTGLYRYAPGTHHRPPHPRPQYRAFINLDNYAVLRAAGDLVYDPYRKDNVWTFGAAHNIHAAGLNIQNPRFDSSGCQVIIGKYSADRQSTQGAWHDFQMESGLIGSDGHYSSGTASGTYQYMLLTGLDASLAAHGGSAFTDYRRLRHGSSGPRVMQMQQKLMTRVSNVFGQSIVANGAFSGITSFATLADMKVNGAEKEYVSPIVVA